MTPLQRIVARYAQYMPDRSIWLDIGVMLERGWVVVSTPELFLLAKPIDSRKPPEIWRDIATGSNEPDTWLVWAYATAAGVNINKILTHCPHPYNFVAFARRTGRLKFYVWEKICTHLKT
jgi:hypothetical protein